MGDARIEQVLSGVGERWPTPNRVAWIAALEATYEREGVLVDGFAQALQSCCPMREICWKGASERRQPETPADEGSRGLWEPGQADLVASLRARPLPHST